MNYRLGRQRVYALLTVACVWIVFTASCSPVNKSKGADLTAVQLFDLRSKCAELGEKLEEWNPRARRVSHYELRTNRCYVQTSTFREGFTAQVNLYDGQTRELLISVKYKDGQPTVGDILMENWKGLADYLGDPGLKNKAVSQAAMPEANPSVAQTLMKRLMHDERLPDR